MKEILADAASGVPLFLVCFLYGTVALLAFLYVYCWVTPYDELKLIRDGNSAPAISLSGSLFGFLLPLCTSIQQSENIWELLLWTLLAAAIQVLVFFGFRFFLPNVVSEIPKGRVGEAIWLAALSIAFGYLQSASMTM